MSKQQLPFLKQLSTIHFAVCAAPIIFIALASAKVYLLPFKSIYTGAHSDLPIILGIIGYGVSTLSLLYGVGVFEKNMRDSKEYGFMKEKLAIFRKSYI